MTLEEQLAELRKKTGRVGFMPQSTEGATQRALEGAGQRPPLPEGRIPSASVMDPQGFQGIKGYDPTRLARRGASYLWSGPEGVAGFDEAEYQRTGKVSGAMDQRQGIEDIRNLYNQTPLVPSTPRSPDFGGAQSQPGTGPVSATVDEVLAGQGGQQSRTGIFQGGQELTPEKLSEAFDAPLRKGEIRIGNAGEDGAFRGTLEDYRSYSEALMKDEEMAGRRQATMGYQTQDQRDGIDRNTMTAIQITDKREMDRRMASINAMPEGPAKEDERAKLLDEQTAKRAAGVKDTDRFTGSIGSPDHKAREGRMAAYQAKIKELSDSRLITKQQAGVMAQQAKKVDREQEKADREQFKFDQEVQTAQQKQEDRDVEAELMRRGLTDKKSIAAANSGFRSMATFNGKIGGKGPRINGAQVTDMFGQMDPEMRMDVMEEAARNVEHYDMDPRAAFMAAFTPFLKIKQRQTS